MSYKPLLEIERLLDTEAQRRTETYKTPVGETLHGDTKDRTSMILLPWYSFFRYKTKKPFIFNKKKDRVRTEIFGPVVEVYRQPDNSTQHLRVDSKLNKERLK